MYKIALIGSFVPRNCGIATFTRDLNESLKYHRASTSIIAINDGVESYDYSEEVKFQINHTDKTSYVKASDYLNTNNFDVVILQHEFGIFGGNNGKHILQLIKRLQIPLITTFHTILDDPSEGQKEVVEEIVAHSAKVISISQKGISILQEVYGVSADDCKHIHHGVPKMKLSNMATVKERFNIKEQKILLTFGLLSKSKSIDIILHALPKVIEKHPNIVYCIVGTTHPNVLKYEGEEYRNSLIRVTKKLNLEKNVLFINRFVSNQELFDLLNICDLYLIPYSGEKQISSGTLIYAMAAGKPIISTPFWYAREMLAHNRGVLVDFNNSHQFSEKIISLLEHDEKREKIAENALNLAKQCYWNKIGEQYLKLVKNSTRKIKGTKSTAVIANNLKFNYALPAINLQQLHALTDSTGIMQHAKYSIPCRQHGYCVDDNARALILTIMLQEDYPDIDEVNRLTNTYLSFIEHAYNRVNGRFCNFMSYERQWTEEEGSQDSNGRAMWALGYVFAKSTIKNYKLHADYLFNKGLKFIESINHPRSLAYFILGIYYYSTQNTDLKTVKTLKKVSKTLYSYFDKSIDNEWLWHNDMVSYANSRIPQALIVAGSFLENEKIVNRGVKILDWLIEKQFVHNIFSPIGNNGWLTPKGKAAFDQQAIEVHGMLDACLAAENYVKSTKYAGYALKAFSWFMGDNEETLIMHDFSTGGGYDGLQQGSLNLNQGAESTLAWLMSLVTISQYLQNNNK